MELLNNRERFIYCEKCGRKELKSCSEACECGKWYCSFNCLVKGLHEVGVLQYSFNMPLDRCGSCAIEKLKQGILSFPWGRKDFKRVLNPNLLIYVNELDQVEIDLGEETIVKGSIKRNKKVSENQLSLF